MYTGLAKVRGASLIIDKLYDNNVKFILFAHHRCVLDKYDEYCY